MRPFGKTSQERQPFFDPNYIPFESEDMIHQELIQSQAVFSEIISDLPAYKFSLAKVKQIYDNAIVQKHRLQQMNLFEQELTEISLKQYQTLEHIKEREISIDAKLKLYRATSRDIMGKISRKKQEKLEIEKRKTLESLAMRNKLSLTLSRRKNILPSLTNQNMVFSVTKLTESTNRRNKEIESLQATKNTLYKPICCKEKLMADLLLKEQEKMDIIDENSALSTKIGNCSLALQLLQSSIELGHSNNEAYTHLINGILQHPDPTLESANGFDDGTVEKETELKLNYSDRFNQLFESGKYLEAAIQAAHSPKGFLRTCEILLRFSEATSHPDQEAPIMIFCEELLDTVPAFGPLPLDMSISCTNNIIKFGKFDLIAHSLLQNSLTFSDELGFVLYSQRTNNRRYLSLAHHVFAALENRPMVATCLYAMERPLALYNYFREFQNEDFVSFLCYDSTIEKAFHMLKPLNDYPPIIDLPNLLLLYLRNGMADLAVQIFFAFFPESNPFSFGNQLLYDASADIGIWEQIAGHFYVAGSSGVGERVFVSILSRHILYNASNVYQTSLRQY